MRVVSGIQPSGPMHIGNYFGAVVQHLALQHEHESFFFIANYHAMTSIKDPALLEAYTFSVAVDYLTLGLNPNKAIFFRQSDIPEVHEFSWMLQVCTGKGLLERAHSYKDKVSKGISPSLGLFTYPALMAADILLYQANLVPVGQDQMQHIEITQDMAQSFNHTYKTDTLKRPVGLLTKTPKVPGLDGDKMSRSYGNTIAIFEPKDLVRKKIMSMKTDSLPMSAKRNPDTCLVFSLLQLFANQAEIESWKAQYVEGGLSYGAIKKRLFELFDEKFGSLHNKREEIENQQDDVESILQAGAQKARLIAIPMIETLRSLTGIKKKS